MADKVKLFDTEYERGTMSVTKIPASIKRWAVKVVLEDGAYMPEKAHEADAGFDLRTPKKFTLFPFYA